jgi:signal transduction histidine kinase
MEVSLQWQGLDGVSRQIVWMGTVDRDARRTVVRGEGLCIDVTLQQQIHESQRQPAKDRPTQGAALEALTNRVSHELRSPLNAILGYVQRLRQAPNEPEAQGGTLDELEKAGRHLLDLVGDAMDLARIESGEAQPDLEDVSLIDLMGELLPLMEQQASQQNVQVELGNLGAWPSVHADRRMLKQALLTIGMRAIARSPERGLVELEFEAHGTQVSVLVHDRGPALSTEEQTRLFEPFGSPAQAQVDAASSTGLRLAIAKHGALAMHGQLRATNHADGGVTLALTLPAASAMVPARPAHGPAQPPLLEAVRLDDAPHGKVLYLEDNPSNVLLVSECLSLRPGIELVVATTVHEALALIGQHRFDLALLDLQLPDGDGYEVLKPLLDQRSPRVPCIALTANAMLNERNRALEAGFEAFWTKPLDLPAFLAGVDQALSRAT